MLIASPSTQAALIFLTSATAVNISGVRLSDIAALLLLLSLFLLKSNDSKRRVIATSLLAMLLFAAFVSFAFQLLNFDPELTLAGLPNAVAVPFGLILALFFLSSCSKQRAAKIAAAYCRIALLTCWILFLWQWSLGHPEWIDLGEVEGRFSALSNNPNQLALFLLPIPFFSILCHMRGVRGRRGVVIDIVAAVLLNFFIIGKGLLVSWTLALLFVMLTGWRFDGPIRVTLNFILVRSLSALPFVLAIAPIAFLLFTGNAPGSQEGQGSIRLALWLNGLEAWTEAPFLGHGPGHYSGLEMPYSGMEAHNFFIDWGSAYGLLGFFFLFSFFLFLFAHAFKARNWVICSFYIALFTQIIFHFYGRQPVFWLWWAFGFVLSLASIDRGGAKDVRLKASLMSEDRLAHQEPTST